MMCVWGAVSRVKVYNIKAIAGDCRMLLSILLSSLDFIFQLRLDVQYPNIVIMACSHYGSGGR